MKNQNNNAGIIALSIAGVVILLFIIAQITKNNGEATAVGAQNSADDIPEDMARLMNNPAPSFTLTDRFGAIFSPESLRGKNVVLFFNEGLMCYPACWNQVVALSKDAELNNDETVSYAVVIDAPADWQRASSKMPELAAANVLFDENKAVSRAYGMLTAPSSMHYGGYPGHSYVVIDKSGVVRFIYDDPNMGIHNDRLKEEIKKLNQQS